MKTTNVNHPSEELLEKFACKRCSEDEIEAIETHILGCEQCVTRLEELDDFIDAFRPAYLELRQRQSRPVKRLSFQWALALASLAILAVGLAFVPRSFRPGGASIPAAQLQLSAERGNEAPHAPAFRPLLISLNATDLPQGTLSAEVVNAVGALVWNGSTRVTHDEAVVDLPPMAAGAYFLRLYAGPKDRADLLREFALQIK